LRSYFSLLDNLDDGDLLAQAGCEQALGDQGVDPAHDVHHLRHPEADGDAAQGVGVELGEIGALGQEGARLEGDCRRAGGWSRNCAPSRSAGVRPGSDKKNPRETVLGN
jgi:hypothetical protein